jgi:DNA-binding CsgD family transcriptional regulator
MDTQEFEEKYAQLTPKLHEVLTQVLQGIPDTDIAENMGIQPATVRKHIERIYRILDLNSDFPEDRRSRRSDLFALFAQHKPEMLLSSPPFSRGAGGDPDPDVTEADNKIDSPPHPQNPFIPLTGMVDNPELFFNREREIRDIFELLNSSSNVAVIGERAIGKSSLLKAIQRSVNNLSQPRKPVYLTLQEVENEQEFYEYLCSEVGIDECSGYQLNRKLKEQRLLLLIDEIDKMSSDGFTYNIRDKLRALAEGIDAPLRLILAARVSLNDLFKEGKTSPLANICLNINLYPWNETTARKFIAKRLDSTPVSFTEEEIAQIIAETGGHPQQLMERCYETYADYLAKNSDR